MWRNMMTKKIIAFAGRKRAGKGMLALGIEKELKNAKIVTVADNLKFLCCELLNIRYSTLIRMKDDGTTFCEKVDGRWVSIINEETGISDKNIWDTIGNHTFTNVREMLQIIGTDLIRKFCPDWHINKTIERINNIDGCELIIVDDVRFPNERCEIEKIGGDVFYVIRPNCFDVSNHPSETALKLSDFDTDKVIINDLPKDKMVKCFVNSYFYDKKDDASECIYLSNNPWYFSNSINMDLKDNNYNASRMAIIKDVIETNKNMPQFINNGIITFKSCTQEKLEWFRLIFMDNRRNSDGKTSYVIYNPITNEYLKNFM